MYFFPVINKVGVNFISDPTQTPTHTAYAFFGQNRSKTWQNRTFFPHYQISPPGGLAYVNFFSD